MKTSPKLQRLVEQVAVKHGLDVYQTGAYLRLERAGVLYALVIENLGAGRVSVALYQEERGTPVPDPEIVCYTEKLAAERTWTPIERCQRHGGWQLYLEVDANGSPVEWFDPHGQAALAAFVEEEFARTLIEQGWLEHGKPNKQKPSLTTEAMRARALAFDYTPEAHEGEIRLDVHGGEEADDVPV